MNQLTNDQLEFSADHAETDLERDLLGYADLAKNIAVSLCHMAPDEGLTVGIIGKWGSGKTTMMNFIKKSVTAIDPSVEVLDFNPWWFSTHEDLVRKLLGQFAAKFDPDTEQGKKLLELFGEYSETLESLPVELKPSLFGFSVDLKKLATLSAKQLSKAKAIPALKREISDTLKQQGIRFLIAIDDADRLTSAEIQNLFRAIKVITDLPNVIAGSSIEH
jgi:predicted KAP-like P-loop ATPase